MKLRMAQALLGIRLRREAAAKEGRARALTAVAAAEAVQSRAHAALVEAVDHSRRAEAEFRDRVAADPVSSAALDTHRSILHRHDERIGEAVVALREAEVATARAHAEAEAARIRHVQALHSVDVGRTMHTRLAKAAFAQQESAAETDVEDLTIARFVGDSEGR